MNNIINIINQLKNTNSNKEKLEILKVNNSNELLKNILYYTMNPYFKYGMSEAVIMKNKDKYTKVETYNDLFEMLDELRTSNINDVLRNKVYNYLDLLENKELELVINIICKNLKIGISTATVNKVWKGLIPSFGVQLAANYKDKQPAIGEKIFITEKLDGIRCVCIYQDGQAKFYSRQGKEIEGIFDIETEINTVCQQLGINDYVFDGELLKENFNNVDSGSLYRETTAIVNSKLKYKKNIIFNIFDILPLKEFVNGKSVKIYEERREELVKIGELNCTYLKIVPLLYSGEDHSKIAEFLKIMENNNKEGIMVNRNFVYETKRTPSILKVKSMQSADLVIIGFEQGRGKNERTLGAIVVDYKGFKVNVGSGFSDEDRDYFWKNRKEFIGKIIEVQFFEESKNTDGGLSLRFPVYLRTRFDKNEPSYN